MDFLKTILWPGYLAWRDGEKLKAILWVLPCLILAGVMFYKILNPEEVMRGEPLEVELMGRQMNINLMRILLVYVFYFLSGLFAYGDYQMRQGASVPIKKEDGKSYDHAPWEIIMGHYLRNELDECTKLIEKQMLANKKDPFVYFMLAKILAHRGEREKAMKQIKKCQKFDRSGSFVYECEQLITAKQLEN